MSNPYLIQIPFALNGDRNDIQVARQRDQDPEDATWNIGFPPQTMIPESAGGLAPKGLDFNGLFYAVSSIGAHYSRGDQIQFDATFAEKIGGYSKGFRLASNDYQCDFISLVDNNMVDPNGTNISQNWRVYAGRGSIPVATSTTSGTVKLIDSLSSTAKDAALTAAQGKVLSDRTQSATNEEEGIVRFATATEVANKANVMAAVTPKNIQDMFISQSNTETLPSGRIFKWGKTSLISDEAELRVNFPNGAFPNAVLSIQLTENIKSTYANNASHVVAINQEKSGFTIYFNSTVLVSTSVDWFAIGY